MIDDALAFASATGLLELISTKTDFSGGID